MASSNDGSSAGTRASSANGGSSAGTRASSPTQRMTDDVYAQLRDDIVSGELPPGARLSVPAIAEALSVSRSPVRDAVLRLVQERLASEEPRRGAVVAQVGAGELAQLYEIREALEGLATRLAVENAGRRFVRTLREVLAEHHRAVDAEDLAAHMEIDMRFHALIRRAGGNPELVRLLDDIQTQVRLAMQTTSVSGGPHVAVREHDAIVREIERGDPDAAERAARQHVARLRASLLERAAAEDRAVAG